MEGRIDLAHEPVFRLGALEVRPALRQLARDDGAQEVLEPRVMQVLVALARVKGAIVGRDDLTRSCWEGRVVGEDAINRVVSRLRRAAEGIGQGAFRIETVTKVGYRLVESEAAVAPGAGSAIEPPAEDVRAELRRLRLDRRAMLIGGGAALVAGGGWVGWRKWRDDSRTPPADVAPLMLQAKLASRQGTTEGSAQALGLLRRVTEMRPDYADGWGLLAVSYAGSAGALPPQAEPAMRARAAQAIARARQLDPANPYATVAEAALVPGSRHWRQEEGIARGIVHDFPRLEVGWVWLSAILLNVGRCREAARAFDRLAEIEPPDPARAYTRIVAYWAANRLDDADRAAQEAAALYPTHFAVWFTRFYLLLYTGRPADALAMVRNVDLRPTGISPANFPMIEEVAQAMLTRSPADIDRAVATNFEAAHRGGGFAENSIQFASALGRVDTAFEIAEAYFFGRGFDMGELRFQPEMRVYMRRSNRRTRILFLPSTAAMRADKRFAPLVREIGLEGYWAATGTRPDYRR